jgi:hypothetical protein
MIKGEYVFYENGMEIARYPNIVTNFGKRYLTSFLAGTVSGGTKDIALGIDSTTVAAEDTRLGFEFYRLPVTLGSIDINSSTPTYDVVYKTTIPQDVVGIIKEIGIYPGSRTSLNNFDSKFITDFETATDWYTADSSQNPTLFTSSPSPIIGTSVSEFKFETGDTTNTTREYRYNISVLDISGYSANDSLTLAYNRAHSNLASIKIKFYTSSGNYYYGTFTPSAGTGEKITSVNMSDVFSNTVGSPEASSISIIGIELTRTSAASAATAYMDGLRINDEDTFDPNFGLISRSVLGTAITKTAGRSIDIEYKLSLGF